jgi:hypothetical protein
MSVPELYPTPENTSTFTNVANDGFAIPMVPRRFGARQKGDPGSFAQSQRHFIDKGNRGHTSRAIIGPNRYAKGNKDIKRVHREAERGVAIANQFEKRQAKFNGELPSGVMLMHEGTHGRKGSWREGPAMDAKSLVSRQDMPVGGVGHAGGTGSSKIRRNAPNRALTTGIYTQSRTHDRVKRELLDTERNIVGGSAATHVFGGGVNDKPESAMPRDVLPRAGVSGNHWSGGGGGVGQSMAREIYQTGQKQQRDTAIARMTTSTIFGTNDAPASMANAREEPHRNSMALDRQHNRTLPGFGAVPSGVTVASAKDSGKTSEVNARLQHVSVGFGAVPSGVTVASAKDSGKTSEVNARLQHVSVGFGAAPSGVTVASAKDSGKTSEVNTRLQLQANKVGGASTNRETGQARERRNTNFGALSRPTGVAGWKNASQSQPRHAGRNGDDVLRQQDMWRPLIHQPSGRVSQTGLDVRGINAVEARPRQALTRNLAPARKNAGNGINNAATYLGTPKRSARLDNQDMSMRSPLIRRNMPDV